MVRILTSCWRTSGKFRLGVVILAFLVALALAGPLIYRPIIGDMNPALGGVFRPWLPPSPEHPLGTDGHGRDLVADYLAGLASSLVIGFTAGLIATSIGVVVGFVAGYKAGWLDAVLTTLTNMLLIIPSYPILVTLSMVLPRLSLVSMSVILAIFSWPFSARTIRAQVIGMKTQPYIDLAKKSGQKDLAIIFAEIMPNLMPYLLMGFTFSTVGAMVAEVGLEVVGLGPSGVITLGLMLHFANGWGAYTMKRYELLLIPVGVLILLFVAITLVNRGMEEYLNPRLQNITGK